MSLIVDATDCPIDAPTDRDLKENLANYRTKDNGHSLYNLKYTVLVQIGTGRIMAYLGPDVGRIPDINAFRLHEQELHLLDEELILGDKGYQGHEKILCGFKNSKKAPLDVDDQVFNLLLDSVRQLVECTFKRLKQFGVLGKSGRWHCARKKHRPVFHLCCQFTNMSMDRDPVWGKVNQLIF
jgi:hypothetical protein